MSLSLSESYPSIGILYVQKWTLDLVHLDYMNVVRVKAK